MMRQVERASRVQDIFFQNYILLMQFTTDDVQIQAVELVMAELVSD